MKIFTAVTIAVKNKLECLSLPLTSTLVYYLEVWLEPTIVEPLMGHHSNGKRLALPSNMKLDLKWPTVANMLAYYDTAKITTVKSFIVQASRPVPHRFYVRNFKHNLEASTF
jgi:hypothetical protein